MNDWEYKIFAKGLENVYGSVLLGEDQALTCIEHLVYLTRELGEVSGGHWPLAAETNMIEHVCGACWPEEQMEIALEEPALASVQVIRESVGVPVCRMLFEAERQGGFPQRLVFLREGSDVRYRLMVGQEVWRQGAVRHE